MILQSISQLNLVSILNHQALPSLDSLALGTSGSVVALGTKEQDIMIHVHDVHGTGHLTRPICAPSWDRAITDLAYFRFRALQAPHDPIVDCRHIIIAREEVYPPTLRHKQRDATRGAALPNREKLESPQNIAHLSRFQFQRFAPAFKDRVHNFRDVTHTCRRAVHVIMAEKKQCLDQDGFQRKRTRNPSFIILTSKNRHQAGLKICVIYHACPQDSRASSHRCSELGNVELRFTNLVVVHQAVEQKFSLERVRDLLPILVAHYGQSTMCGSSMLRKSRSR